MSFKVNSCYLYRGSDGFPELLDWTRDAFQSQFMLPVSRHEWVSRIARLDSRCHSKSIHVTSIAARRGFQNCWIELAMSLIHPCITRIRSCLLHYLQGFRITFVYLRTLTDLKTEGLAAHAQLVGAGLCRAAFPTK